MMELPLLSVISAQPQLLAPIQRHPMPQSFQQQFPDPAIRRQLLRRGLLWTLVMAVFLGLGAYFFHREKRQIALGRARDSFQKDVTTWLWATQRGAIYVPLDGRTVASLYLKDLPTRDITATTGKRFTLVNPAYMTRMIHDLGKAKFGLQGHITSLRPIRPENAPDAWEQQALRTFESGSREYWEESTLKGPPHLRFMGALITEESCLGCHAFQGYKVGDVQGGISVTVPFDQGSSLIGGIRNLTTTLAMGLLWILGLGVILMAGQWNQTSTGERKRAEEALQESEEKHRVLFRDSPDAYLIIVDGVFVDCNRATEVMLRGDRTQIVGQPPELLSPEFQPDGRTSSQAAEEKIREALRTGTNTFEWVHRRLDGTDFFVEVSIASMLLDGKPALFTTWRDITERKQAEEERHHLQVQLHQAQKMESLGSLAGGVAHDMNNVLGAILGLASANLELLPVDSPAHRAFDTISKAAIRGGKMVKSLLTFARQSPAEARELDVNTILREEARLLEHTTLSKVHLEMDLASDLHPILGDASALTHAFMNLCVNAVDSMPENGNLTLRTRNVDQDWIEVLVQDTGAGMPKEVLEKAMDPFFTTKEQGKGTGLGLSMVYNTVKAHQGQLEIQSEPGQGTRVRMRFPACEPLLPPTAPTTASGSEPSHANLSVLVVDDDELVQSSMRALLEVLGHSSTAVSSGEEALAKLEAGLQPDVVILDMNMPGLGGSGTLPRLRNLRPTLPVLLATGRADQTALNLVEAHPGVTLLSKPFSMKQLQQHLESPWRER